MKKKIGVITLNGYCNYGNRLQNYATQEILSTLGFNVETIVLKHEEVSNNKINKKRRILKFTNTKKLFNINFYLKLVKKLYEYFYKNKINHLDELRSIAIKSFSNKYIFETNFYLSNTIQEGLSDKYDYFIVGSDQVWNPGCIMKSSIYFLDFADYNKRIAFAPSFGFSDIPLELREIYTKGLSQIKSLSIREEKGYEIIKELTGRSATVVVDPTLLLSKEKWLSISRKAKGKPDKNYLLTYFLGDTTIDMRKKIKRIANDNNLKIINLLDIKDVENYVIGPSEFIDYIYSANIICTDSFHGTVFSIIFEKPFVVFDRVGTSMYSRIDTLLNKFDLNYRKSNNINCNNIFDIDYLKVRKNLDKEIHIALNYLKKALNIL